MWDMLQGIDRWLTWRRQRRRARRRWRDIKFFLILILLCILFNLFSLMCGLTGYTLQRLGLLPTVTPTPISGSVSNSVHREALDNLAKSYRIVTSI